MDPRPTIMEVVRKIVHIDADAFFASIEQRDDPALRGKPVAVGGDSARGVVAAASYEARRYGVHSAMPSRMARERCPGLIFVRPRFNVYREVGEQLREIFHRYTDLVEPLSIDEAFLDVTEPKIGPPSGTLIAREIKAQILRETRLTVSAGVSYCKFLAKLASDWEKPDGLTVFTPEDAQKIIDPLPVEKIHGVGPKTAQKMHGLGIRAGRDLRELSEEELVAQFGKLGSRYYWLSRGVDERPVDPNIVRKSVSSEETFDVDLESVEELLEVLPLVVRQVAARMERHGVMGRGVTVKVKLANHEIVTRQLLLPLPVRSVVQIEQVAAYLLRTRFTLAQPVRLLGVGVYELSQGVMMQPPLFDELVLPTR